MDDVGCSSFEDVLGNLNDMVEDLKTICHIQQTSHVNNNREEISPGDMGDTDSLVSFASVSTDNEGQPILPETRKKKLPALPPRPVSVTNVIQGDTDSLDSYDSISIDNDEQPILAEARKKKPPALPPRPSCMTRSVSVPASCNANHSKANFVPQGYRNDLNRSNVPDPFPELGAEATNNADNAQECPIKVYSEDGSSKTIIMQNTFQARDVCCLMVLKSHASDDKNWVLVEQLTDYGLERCLEDHEVVMEVYRSWPENANNKFVFRKNFLKYQLFENPSQFFPPHMVLSKEDFEGITESVEEARKILLERLFMNTDRIPDLEGQLHSKEAHKRSWKKSFFMLRGSGIYFSTKGTSKEAKHLQCFSQFTGVHVYNAINGRKKYGAPTDSVFCLKAVTSTDVKDIKCLCAESEESRQCWVTGIRLAKYGTQLLRQNFQTALRRHAKLNDLRATSSPKAIRAGSDRVAMDFTHQHGRVVQNPTEAMAVAIAEGHEWRKKGSHRAMGSPRLSGSPLLAASPLSTGSPILAKSKGIEVGVHITQPWFHSGLSREESEQLLTQHGTIDGLYLLRESHRQLCHYVLSLCYGNKIRHYQITPIEDQNGHTCYSLDDGATKFMDLVQLVEFYELNPAGLPIRLRQCCTKLM
ncbi:growth factor receptor-bound protein 14-like isoform X2 [Ptychodera flava]|uniref:growth factor receptor-bound protein 14-like isoform X2 n=1 Tax=Ptychodera flava TaxID=63121 RepID=UPI00396A22E8